MRDLDLIGLARDAVGSADTITVAEWFHPRGTNARKPWAAPLSGSRGGLGVRRGDGMEPQMVPLHLLVGASATRIHGWRLRAGLKHFHCEEELFDYASEEVTTNVIRQRSVDVFEIFHPATSEKWELETRGRQSNLDLILATLSAAEPN